MTEADIANIQRHRDEAFIECPRPLWVSPRRFGHSVGPQVVPLTWARYHQLLAEGHRILRPEPGLISTGELLRTLWVLSPSFSHSRRAFRQYRHRHLITAHLQRARLQSHLRAFILDAFLEAPSSQSQASESKAHSVFPPAHLLGGIIVSFARLYGWSRREILEMPIAQSYQLQNTISGVGNPAEGEPAFNAVEDRKAGEALRAKQAKLRAQLERQNNA